MAVLRVATTADVAVVTEAVVAAVAVAATDVTLYDVAVDCIAAIPSITLLADHDEVLVPQLGQLVVMNWSDSRLHSKPYDLVH